MSGNATGTDAHTQRSVRWRHGKGLDSNIPTVRSTDWFMIISTFQGPSALHGRSCIPLPTSPLRFLSRIVRT
jgi:hypothetical protein